MRLSALARDLERRAARIALGDYHTALEKLDDIFAVSRRELNAYLQKAGGGCAEVAD
jgi:hypothetical protein